MYKLSSQPIMESKPQTKIKSMYQLTNQPKLKSNIITKKNMQSIKNNCKTITAKNAQACLGYRNTKLVDPMNPNLKNPTKKRKKPKKKKKVY